MSAYKEIKGFHVQVVTSDPSNPVEGQIWYNSTTGAFRIRVNGSTETLTEV